MIKTSEGEDLRTQDFFPEIFLINKVVARQLGFEQIETIKIKGTILNKEFKKNKC